MNGKGVMEWPGGRKYDGEFKDDMREGSGKLMTEDGKVFEGAWSKGKFVQNGMAVHDSNININSVESLN